MKYLFQVILISFISVGLVSCEDIDFESTEAGEVIGMWQSRLSEGDNRFLLISERDFIFYDFNARKNCVETDAYQVIRRDGTGFFQVEKGDGSPERVFAVSINNEQLQLRRTSDPAGVVEYFFMSTTNLSGIPECIKETDIQGKWEFQSSIDKTLVDIKEDTITVFSEFSEEGCFEIIDYKIDGSTGNIYKLLDQIGQGLIAELFVEIRRTEDGLEITLEEDGGTVTDIYSSSTTDFTTLLPDCGLSFPPGSEGIWEFEGVANTTESNLHMELKQDTLRYYTFLADQSCTDINNHPVRARRGDSYFLSNGSDFIDLFYRIFFDNDVLVTRISQDGVVFDERFVRSNSTVSELESNLCTTDF